MLTAIKLLHTVIWAFMAASIMALPIPAVLRRFRWVAILTIIVLLECLVLAVNGGKCPPNWLASHNKSIFGTLFVVNELIVLWCWVKRPRLSPANDGGT